jgi:hypothetical protein
MLLVVVASTFAVGKTCQWLRRRLIADEPQPPGGFEVVKLTDPTAAPHFLTDDAPPFIHFEKDPD